MIAVLLFCLPSVHSARYDDDQYFDINDETKADCIPSSAMNSYNYLGDRNLTVQRVICLPWRTVYDDTVRRLKLSDLSQLQQYQKIVKPEEVMLHNKCRRWNLPPTHPMRSYTSAKNGPWCYYKSGNTIKSESCFHPCRGQPREEKAGTEKQYGDKKVQKNYNDVLIENIRKYYKSYAWGDASYYRWKPSDDTYSAEYYRVREQIFYGCAGTVVFLILWLLLCSYLRKEAAAARRRREEALKLIFPNRKIQLNPVVRPHVT
ncbi:hypothetical protein Q1695_002160 [Nippostrongylus brasiliensis]|nr:hypothetical protein Q1695_002160 [Nippostrongylus brasiliensis]